MNKKRTIEIGHAASLTFAGVLLLSASRFLVEHGFVSAFLLAAFAPIYLFAARTTGRRYFLYPFALLLVLAYNLLLHALGIPATALMLFSVLPLVVFYYSAGRPRPLGLEDAAEACYRTNAVIIFVFTAFALFSFREFARTIPDVVTVVFLCYSAYFVARFLKTSRVYHHVLAVAYGLSGVALLLHTHPSAGLLLGAVLILACTYRLLMNQPGLWPDALFFAIMALYLAYEAHFGPKEGALALGFAAIGLAVLKVGLLVHRPGGMHSVFPLFLGAVLMSLVPLFLLFPYTNTILCFTYLLVLTSTFFEAAGQLRDRGKTFIGIAFARFFGVAALAGFFGALGYLAWKRFPSSFTLAILAGGFAHLAAIAGLRTPAAVLKRRSLFFYLASAYLTAGYTLLLFRANPLSWLPDTLHLPHGYFPLNLLWLVVFIAGLAAGKRMAGRLRSSLFDGLAIVAIGAVVQQALVRPDSLPQVLFIAGILIAMSVAAYLRHREPSILYSVPVALGLLLFALSLKAGLAGENLGVPFFLVGLGGFAAVGAFAESEAWSRWRNVWYFIWFFCFAVSLALFFPYRATGAILAPLWACAFLVAPGLHATRSDRPMSIVLELLGHLYTALSIVILLASSSFRQAGIALFVYAALYAYLTLRERRQWYFYPANFFLAAGLFTILYQLQVWPLYLIYSIPLALLFYSLVVLLYRRGLGDFAHPVSVVAAGNAFAAGLLFVLFAPASARVAGLIAGGIYVLLYLFLLRERGSHYTAGVSLAASFLVYQVLLLVPAVAPGARLAWFAPLAVILAETGRRVGDRYGAARTGLYAAAVILAALCGFFAIWPGAAFASAARFTLLSCMVVWLLLLLTTQSEVFIYLASLTLAVLSYSFLQASSGPFFRHMFIFFLYGAALLGAVFLVQAGGRFIRYRKPVLLVPGKKWTQRFAYLTPIVLIVAATVGGSTFESTSNPVFCGTCHSMNKFYANWERSSHGRLSVGCPACHYEPGMMGYVHAKIRGFSEAVKEVTATANYRPMAAVSDRNCLAEGCHSLYKLGMVKTATIDFDHRVHLQPLLDSVQLKCTSCHSKPEARNHFGIDRQTCYACHFAARATATQRCTSCHEAPPDTKFQHSQVLDPSSRDSSACLQCHDISNKEVSAVDTGECANCHMEELEALKPLDTATMHSIHTNKQNIKCTACHRSLPHGRAPLRAS